MPKKVMKVGISDLMLAAPLSLLLPSVAHESIALLRNEGAIFQGSPARQFHRLSYTRRYIEGPFLDLTVNGGETARWTEAGTFLTRLSDLVWGYVDRETTIENQIFATVFTNPTQCHRFIREQQANQARLIVHTLPEWKKDESSLLELSPKILPDLEDLNQIVRKRIETGEAPFLVDDYWHACELRNLVEWGTPEMSFYGPQVALIHGQLRRDDHGREYRQFLKGIPTGFQNHVEYMIEKSPASEIILEAEWRSILGLSRAAWQPSVSQATLAFFRRAKHVFGGVS